MTKQEFLTALSAELAALPEEERRLAVAYYDDYFADAGEENELAVLRELGDPKTVAQSILDDYYKDKPKPEPTGQIPPAPEKPKQTIPLWAIVLIALFAVPMVVPLLGGLFGAAVGILVAILAIFFSLGIVAIALLFSGVAVAVASIAAFIAEPLLGFLTLGTGLLLTGIGILGTILIVKFYVYIIPKFIRGIVYLCRWPFQKRQQIV